MEQIKIVESPKGVYHCEPNISADEWVDILSNEDLTTSNYKTAIMAFYNESGHKSTCKVLSVKLYGDSTGAQKINNWITNFGKAVVKYLNRFQIIDFDGSERFWHVTMCMGKKNDEGLFETTLRPELVQAIEKLGWNTPVAYSWIPFYMEMADKLLMYKNRRKELVDIVYALGEKYVGYIRSTNGGHVSDMDPFTVFGTFNRHLSNDNRIQLCKYFKEKLDIKANLPSEFNGVPVLNNMMSTFYWRRNESTDIQPLWNLFEVVMANDSNNLHKCFDIVCKQLGIKWNITMGLFWIRPYDYISLDSRNREYLPTLGINIFKETQIDSVHYFPLLQEVKKKISENVVGSIPEISYKAWLGDTNISAKPKERKYWLTGYTFGSEGSQIEKFIGEGIWESKHIDGNASDQKLLGLAQQISQGDILILKSTSTKGVNHDRPFMRIKGAGIVTSDISTYRIEGATKCQCSVEWANIDEHDFEGSIYGSYRKTIHQADSKVKDIIEYVNGFIYDKTKDLPMEKTLKYKEYIELLQENHNLVLTGAPGTGKTYMAHEIAKEMDAEIEFVQFHPSYDYTDFVEGLRPIDKGDGQVGFERKDGIFKEFCKRAIKNLLDSRKSLESLKNEISWQEKLDSFIEEAMEDCKILKLVNGNDFAIKDIKGHNIIVRNEQNEKTTEVSVNADEILELLTNEVTLNIVRDIRDYYGRKFGTQPDSYAFAIIKAIREAEQIGPIVKPNKVNKVEKKNFVFIIDEINRGEVSKIFGELFYAIDPGYRGKKDKLVQTQYQNLLPESDVFSKGFYVPENVYILATMNDIDRSVESMDFAMRRRFTWKEVTPSDTEDMLDELSCAIEAKATMMRLNNVISETEGLGAAYVIGPSYFLKLKKNGGDFEKLWRLNIEPLLKEYLRGFRKSENVLKKMYEAYFNTKEKSNFFEEE